MSTRIREFRKLRSMTLQFLAQKVGTTAQTIQRLETNNMTVSLDWLERIADAFGVPSAALLVSDATASVPVVGDLDASGEVIRPEANTPLLTLSLVISAPAPLAVRVISALKAFEPETLLIAGKAEVDLDLFLTGRDCLVGLKSGRILFRGVTATSTGLTFKPSIVHGLSEDPGAEIDWVAPILMAVRYF